MERKEAEQHKHKFKRKDIVPASKEKPEKKQKPQPKLSFQEDE